MEIVRAPDTGEAAIALGPGEQVSALDMALLKSLEMKRKRRMGELEANPPARAGRHAGGRTKSRAERKRLRRAARKRETP